MSLTSQGWIERNEMRKDAYDENRGFLYLLSLIPSLEYDPQKLHETFKRSILGSKWIGLHRRDDWVFVMFTETLTTEEIAERDSIMSGHDATDIYTPKIMSMIQGGVDNLHFQDIDYTIHVKPNLYPVRDIVRGEVVNVKWYKNPDATDLVLNVDVVYVRDPYGFPLSRTTTRKWVQNNGEYHPDEKVTVKSYVLNAIDQIKEGKRRRENIINELQMPTLAFLLEVLAPQPQNLILLEGRRFMDSMEQEFNKFIDNSSTITDLADENVGRKSLAVAFENAPETWLDLQPVALAGATIRQWLVGEVSI